MLHRLIAAVLERYLSSRSPPDHLLYQMLKTVPVCGGGSDLRAAGSTCGRAGRRLRRIIFFVFFSPTAVSDGPVRAVSSFWVCCWSVSGVSSGEGLGIV